MRQVRVVGKDGAPADLSFADGVDAVCAKIKARCTGTAMFSWEEGAEQLYETLPPNSEATFKGTIQRLQDKAFPGPEEG